MSSHVLRGRRLLLLAWQWQNSSCRVLIHSVIRIIIMMMLNIWGHSGIHKAYICPGVLDEVGTIEPFVSQEREQDILAFLYRVFWRTC